MSDRGAAERDVTIVVPVWNRADLLRKLLLSISQQSARPREVIVVDNASSDDAAEVAASWGARVIALSRNTGFAFAVNRGIEQARTDWVAVVNSDVELAPDWLLRLHDAAVEESAWFATGKIFQANDPSRLDGSWDLLARSGCAWRAGHGLRDAPEFSSRRSIALAPATAVLYRRDLFAKVGEFAEEFDSYLEDVDLSLRCAAHGLAGVYEPSAVCTHHGSASAGVWSSRTTYLISRNQMMLVKRLYSPDLRSRWRWQIFVGQFLWGMLALWHGRLGPWLRGKWDAQNDAGAIPLDRDKLSTVIIDSEREIRMLGAESSLYWKLYFLFASGESQ